jgi:hypothetical protein
MSKEVVVMILSIHLEASLEEVVEGEKGLAQV